MLTDFAEIWWLVCNLMSQRWRKISLKSHVVRQSYGNVYRVIVFSWTQCTFGCWVVLLIESCSSMSPWVGVQNVIISTLDEYELSLKISNAVTILKSRLKIAIFCQNRPKSKSLHLLSHVSISSCVDFLQQLMHVTGLKDYNFRRFQTEYCVYTKHGLKIE